MKILRIGVVSRIVGRLVEGRSWVGVLLVVWVIVLFRILILGHLKIMKIAMIVVSLMWIHCEVVEE